MRVTGETGWADAALGCVSLSGHSRRIRPPWGSANLDYLAVLVILNILRNGSPQRSGVLGSARE
jgi:hypothetical protein